MKINRVLLPLIAVTLCGCAKTDRLYKNGAYNSPNFYANYYLKEDTKDFVIANEVEENPLELHSYDGLKYLHEEDVGGYHWIAESKENLWGYHNNLARVDERFKLGAISKLYDGRVRCDGLYQKSRAQLDKVGYSAKFPLTMKKASYFAFSCRGATTLEEPLQKEDLKFNFTVSFFTINKNNPDTYIKHNYHLNNLEVNTDNSSSTNLVSFYIEQSEENFILENTVAMSLSWECADIEFMNEHNLSDDRKVKEKDHLAIMLYEVFLGNSTWVK